MIRRHFPSVLFLGEGVPWLSLLAGCLLQWGKPAAVGNPTSLACLKVEGSLSSFWLHLKFSSVNCIQFSSVQSLSHLWRLATRRTAAHQASLSITNSGVYPNPCPLSQWCHPTTSSSVIPFSSCLQSLPASGSFQSSSHQVAKIMEFQLQNQSFQWTPRTDLL